MATSSSRKGIKFVSIMAAVLAVVIAGCTSSSLKQTAKSPSYSGGPVKNVAVLAMTGRDFYRQAIENHFVAYLKEGGQSAIITHNLLAAPVTKADRPGAIARLREAGADSVMLVRLVDSATYSQQARAGSGAFTSSAEEAYWYLGARPDVTWNSLQTDVYIETSIHALESSERIWSGTTRTVLKENTDIIKKIEPLARKLFASMRQDGVIR